MARRRHVEVYEDKAGLWRWRLFAANGKEIGRSEQGYVRHGYCMRAASERNPGITVIDLKVK